jgi:hypothetical protein
MTNALFDLLRVNESILQVPTVVALARAAKEPPTVSDVEPVIATESE